VTLLAIPERGVWVLGFGDEDARGNVGPGSSPIEYTPGVFLLEDGTDKLLLEDGTDRPILEVT
jgi:hypothetical protein